MFGIGPGELLLVAGLALVVVGPSKLPSLMKDASQAMSQIKKASQSVMQAVEADPELGEVSREVRSAIGAAKGEFTKLPPGLDDELMVCRPEEEWAAAIAAADVESGDNLPSPQAAAQDTERGGA